MFSIRSALVCLSLCSLLAVPTLASAATCKVLVTDGGNAKQGAKVEGKANGNLLPAVFTDEGGLAKLSWTTTSPLDVQVDGLVAGSCTDRLSVELSTLTGQTTGTDATNQPVGGEPATGTDATSGQTTQPPVGETTGETSSENKPGTDATSGDGNGNKGSGKGTGGNK